MSDKNKKGFFSQLLKEIRRIIYIMVSEYRYVFGDSGLVVVFIGATIIYPLLYSSIYKNETIRNMPIAVVDQSNSLKSRKLISRLDATPDLKVVKKYNNIEEIKDPFYRQNIHGAIYIPKDFSKKIDRKEQATVSVYSDMSSFLYYRAMVLGSNYTLLDANKDVKEKRMFESGKTGQLAEVSANPYKYKGTILYNETMGFASFLLPALLILMIHQTLFFGITMIAGTTREVRRKNNYLSSYPQKLYSNFIGKSLCYFTLYMVIAPYILLLIPHLFKLPHIGYPLDVIKLMVPFLFAVIFFSMTISVFIRDRETGLVILLFFSVILLFLSGFSWPQSNINWFWRTFGMLFPSTFGIQGYIKISSMGASIDQVRFEYLGLWIQAIAYFFLAIIVYHMQWRYDSVKTEKKNL